MLLYDALKLNEQESPDSVAIIFRDEPISYSQLIGRVDALKHALAAHGVGPGTSVAAVLPNCPEFTALYYAVSGVGAMFVPTNPLLKPHELEYIWSDCKAQIVFTIPALAPVVQETINAMDSSMLVVICSTDENELVGALRYDHFVAMGAIEQSKTPVNPHSAAVCIYTSGTTGRPKGAMLSHANLLANCRQACELLDISKSDNFLCVLPMFHSFAATVCQNLPLVVGGRFTILEQFHPGRVLSVLEQHKVTVVSAVPAMYQALLNFDSPNKVNFSTVRFCVSGGAPMPTALMHAIESKFDTIILEGDGPTECSPATCLNPPYGVRKPGSVGLALPGMEMRIVDDEDQELATGEIGEMVVRGPNVMLGYLNRPEETAEAMKNGWYHTGDLGKVDEDGYFFILDRKKDMLLVGGLNVYPREIEEILYAHPAVQDAAVIGVPDAAKGEAVIAIIVLKSGQTAESREIIKYCRELIANYKVPRKVYFRDSLPRGGTGKILKRLLRKEMEME